MASSVPKSGKVPSRDILFLTLLLVRIRFSWNLDKSYDGDFTSVLSTVSDIFVNNNNNNNS